MAIKNYTSTVSTSKSIGEIQGALAEHGATRIVTQYNNKLPIGIMFEIETPVGLRVFSVPANIDGVRNVMERQRVKADNGQAERTAWRNVRDWVLAQMAIIEAGMVQMEEVFFPYMTDGKGRTVYQLYQGGVLALEGGTEQ